MSNSITLNNSGQLQVTVDNAVVTGVTPAVVTRLSGLVDVDIEDIQAKDRLVFDEATQTWKNQNEVDGGEFT